MRDPKNMLVYYGTQGIGKTHLCACLFEWAFQRFEFFRYWHEKELLKRLRDGISQGFGDYARALEDMIDDEFVILDDVGSSINAEHLGKKDLEWKREIFFHFLDCRYNSQKPTLITSNFTKDQFYQVYSPRICSRLFDQDNKFICLFDENLDRRAWKKTNEQGF